MHHKNMPTGDIIRGYEEQLQQLRRELEKESCLRSQAEQRLADILNFLPDATFVINWAGIVVVWNRAMEEMTGIKAADMLGKGNYEYSIPLYGYRRPLLIDIVKQAGGAAEHFLEFKRNGHRISAVNYCPKIGSEGATLAGAASLLYDMHGKPVGAIESIRDISGRVRNEMSLQQSQEKFSKAFHGNPIMMIIMTLDGTIIDVNKAFCASIGYKRHEIIGLCCKEVGFFRNPEMSRYIEAMLGKRNAIENHPIEFYDKSGLLHEGRLWSQCLDLGGAPSHLSCVIDVSEQVRLEQEMEHLDRLRLVGQTAASIGHEIRNPMTTIRGFLQLLINDKAYAKDRDYFELMIEELDRANGIISSFLGMAGNKQSDLQPLCLDEVVQSIYPMILADANFRGMAICLQLDKTPPLPIDEKGIRQLIINLVRNGLEAMTDGGTLIIGIKTGAGEVTLYIKDEGHGLAPDIAKQIATPFKTTKDMGTGLGLPICYSIARRHQATIDFETGPDGTTFFIHFPNFLLD